MTTPGPEPITDEQINEMQGWMGDETVQRMIARIRADADKIAALAQSLHWAWEERNAERKVTANLRDYKEECRLARAMLRTHIDATESRSLNESAYQAIYNYRDYLAAKGIDIWKKEP